MTGVLVSTCLGLLSALIWLTARRRTLSTLVLWGGALTAPVLIFVAFLGAANGKTGEDGRPSRLGEYRLKLESFSLPAGGEIAVGSSEQNDIIVSRSAGSVLTIRAPFAVPPKPSGEVQTAYRPIIRMAAAAPTDIDVSAVSINGQFQGGRPWRLDELLCVERCTSADAKWYQLIRESGSLRFVAAPSGAGAERAATAVSLPKRVNLTIPRWWDETAPPLLSIPAPRGWRPSQAVHPLRAHLPTPAARTLRSVVYQQGGWSGSNWNLLVLDDNLWVRTADGRPERLATANSRPGQPVEQPVDLGAAVAVWDVRYRSEVSPGQAYGRLQERRSFTLEARGDGAAGTTLKLGTPAMRIVGSCPAKGQLRIESDIRYPILGRELATAFDRTLSWPPGYRCHQFTFAERVLKATTASGEIQLNLQLERFGLPWPVPWIVLAWSLAAILLQSRTWRENPTHWAVYCVLQVLLAFRILVAISGAGADPEGVDFRQILPEALTAYAACGGALILLAPPLGHRGIWVGSLGLLIACVPFASQLVWERWPGGLSMAIAVVAAAVALLLAGLDAAGRLSTPPAWLAEARAQGKRMKAWFGILLTASVPRAILGFLSMKERVFGIAVSAFYTPMLILGFAGLFAEALRADDANRHRLGLAFCACLAVTLFVLPWFVRDHGYAIIALPLAGMAGWAMLGRRGGASWLDRVLWAGPACAMGLTLCFILGAGAISTGRVEARNTQIEQAAQATSDDDALDILEGVIRDNGNELRLRHRLDPEWLIASGSGESENLRQVSNHLSEYTGSPWGHGYLHDVNLSVLKPVHLNDNVSAVHLMAPFGRMTAAALLILMALLPLALARLRPVPEGEERTAAEIVGYLSMWVLFGVGAYIVLANLQLVPFTGRNIYLLAASSDSDLLEGLTLLLFGYLGVSWRPAETPAETATPDGRLV